MHYSKQFGLAVPELGWVPAPTYILRRAAILELIINYPPGRVLEIGCGSGALLYDLSRHGFYGFGVEQSVQAFRVASKILADIQTVSIVEEMPEQQESSFDYLLAFEVLEHINDDEAALHEWTSYLKNKGLLFLSVLAHKHLWSNSDVWAGHFRRYERNEIVSKINNSVFSILVFHSYGWPLSNLILPLRSWLHGIAIRRKTDKQKDMFDKTLRSGVDRFWETRLFPVYGNKVSRCLISIFIRLQRKYYNSDKGVGYLIVAQKL